MKKIVRFVAIALLAAVLSALCGCSAGSPQDAAEEFFVALRTLDEDRLRASATDGNIGTVSFSTLDGERADIARKLLNASVSYMSDGIDDTSALEAETAEMIITLTRIDYASLFAETDREISMTGGKRTDIVSARLGSGDFKTVSREITLLLVRQDGRWTIPISSAKNPAVMNELNITYIIKWLMG